MDDNYPPPTQFWSESSKINRGSDLYLGAFFPRSQNFTVSESTFISNNYSEPVVPPDFRRIPFGDINLKHEMRLCSQSGVVDRYRVRGSVRQMHSARIHGDNSDMTVALYQGDNAEEEWKTYIAKHSRVCHPNFIQIFAAASRSGIHAIVVHDDLIPFHDFLQLHHDSPILTIYIYGCWSRDLREANQYSKHIFGDYLRSNNSTLWIRSSTGRLCVDLIPGDVAVPGSYPYQQTSFNIQPLNDPNSETMVIDSLELGEYHDVCYWQLIHQRTFPVSMQAALHLGAVVYSPRGSELHGLDEIAFLPDAKPHISNWYRREMVGDTMEDGWTRCKSAEISGTTLHLTVDLEWGGRKAWLPQANHIFNQLQIKSNHKDYVIIYQIQFWLKILAGTQTSPDGYLFVCPTRDLQTRPTLFKLPECPAYWSPDPSGTQHLNADEAIHLGFPSIEPKMEVRGIYCDSSVYAGLHKFHRGKGFNPDSQDVALLLGHYLYQVSQQPYTHTVEVSGAETGSKGSSQADCLNKHERVLNPQHIPPCDVTNSVPQSWSWKAVMFFQLGLILALGFTSLYEYGQAVLSQRDI